MSPCLILSCAYNSENLDFLNVCFAWIIRTSPDFVARKSHVVDKSNLIDFTFKQKLQA